jgi:formiminoglutamase
MEKRRKNLNAMYIKPQPWTGRIDGNEEGSLRWHQVVRLADILDQIKEENSFYGILGFACDEGVRRNKGRQGAKEGPVKLREFSSNFPKCSEKGILDFGNVFCEGKNLEDVQRMLSDFVAKIHEGGGKSIVLGGGHEVLLPHFSGLRKAFPKQKIGIINFDAHFDNRAVNPEIGSTSGTGFWEIDQMDNNYAYLAIGIQENANTKSLFDFAGNAGTQYLLAKDFYFKNEDKINAMLHTFIKDVEVLYVTVCLDVFAAPFAPGVSAVAYNGLFPDVFFQKIFKEIVLSEKLKAFDIAELNPAFDLDNRTARLGASLLFEVIN